MALDSLILIEAGDTLLLEDGSGGYGLESAQPVVPVVPVSKGGHVSRKPRVVFVDQPEEPPEPQPIPERNILRLTPEVQKMLDRHKKKGPKSGLVGSGKGLIN